MPEGKQEGLPRCDVDDSPPCDDIRMSLSTPTLATERLILRPFTDADADDIYALQSDAEVLRYWDSPPCTERAEADRFLERCRTLAEEGSGVRLVLEDKNDGAFLGWIMVGGWNPTFRSASIGYCLGKSAWGHGYTAEAARAVLDWAFDAFEGLNRVEGEADTRNMPSRRVLEKLGFTLEGTKREDCIVDGVVSDTWIMSLLRREWPTASSPDSETP